MVQLSATRCSYIAILWVSLMSFAAITLCVCFSTIITKGKPIFRYRLSPETFGYTVAYVYMNSTTFEQYTDVGCFNTRIM
jgi:hypothetical protein